MGKFIIKGGTPLQGEVRIGGGKNAVLPILAATVLYPGISYIHDCPKIVDVFTMIRILESIGCRSKWEGKTLIVDTSTASSFEVPPELVSEMRSSIILLGSILGRFRQIKISYPGGCSIGPRPIDLHLKALKQMGVQIQEEHGYILCQADRLQGVKIHLDFPSVGATENIMLAAVLAKGRTMIYNPAKEPEIIDLQDFLNCMGAKITGAGSNIIVIDGVNQLSSVEYTVIPDRIVTGTYLVAAAISGGEALLHNVRPQHLYAVTAKLRETGCIIREENTKMHIKARGSLQGVDMIRTHPYPGFPTDMQAQMMALLTIAKGTSVISETVFESRYKHAEELMRMGAQIKLEGRTAIIQGVSRLMGATVKAEDLRGGAALILAGLCAENETTVCNSMFIERGYEHIDYDLQALGAQIIKIRDEEGR
ncbi:MAG: UDP-N-acetylglucosamine 1-carboxyvinyltransferase [Epulopiscium sp.]|nr:UDP-N-acetylglucosamine 1-carboxyvinyltransferase [Candidatus Epulonipiscium sp.]